MQRKILSVLLAIIGVVGCFFETTKANPWQPQKTQPIISSQDNHNPSSSGALQPSVPETGEKGEPRKFESQMIYPPPYIYLPEAVPPRSQSLRNDYDVLFGLTPSEILQLRREYEERQRAATREPAEMRSSTIPVSLQPGSAIPIVFVSPGYVSAISIIDKYGNPWPIVGVSWGNKSDYQIDTPHTIVQSENNGTTNKNNQDIPNNIIHISPLSSFGSMGISILLQGQSTPIVCKVIVDLKKVDARVDFRVQGVAPGGIEKPSSVAIPDQFATTDMVGFLDGVPPQSAQRLTTDSDDILAWIYNGKMIIRSQEDLVSPRWYGIEYGANNVRVYQTTISPIILFYSKDGETKMVRVRLPEKSVFKN